MRLFAMTLVAMTLASSTAHATIIFSFLSRDLHDPDLATMDQNLGIAGLSIEDFADDQLLDGFTLTIANEPAAAVSQNGVHTDQSVFPTRSDAPNWDGTGVIVVELGAVFVDFDTPVTTFGIGLGGYINGPEGMTFTVNGTTSITGPQVAGPYVDDNLGLNAYLLITASGGDSIDTVEIDISIPPSDGGTLDHMAFTVPEPSTAILTGLGLVGLALKRRAYMVERKIVAINSNSPSPRL